jgi:diaminopimelate decarboxylase
VSANVADDVVPAGRTGDDRVRRLGEWNAETLVDLADEYGTPTYVLDLDRVRENYRRFTGAVPSATVHYAAKANSSPALLRTMLDAGANVEVASPGELRRAFAAGFDGEATNYTAVNPPAEELYALVASIEEHPEMTVTVGAVDTIERLEDRGFDGAIAVRVNPGVGAGHHERVATGADRQFGVPLAKAEEIIDCDCASFDVVGLHAHVGSGILDGDLARYERALDRVTETARRIDDDIEFVDLGGGFGVPYHPSEAPLDLERVAEILASAMAGVEAELKLEPGRYIAADAGVLLTRVNTVKRSPAGTVAGVDAGLESFMRSAMFDAYHPVRNLSGTGRDPEAVSIGGPVCSSSDTLCESRELARVERGDVVAVGNAGAYGYELSARFHSRPRPAEVAVRDGETTVARRRGTVEEVLAVDEYDG